MTTKTVQVLFQAGSPMIVSGPTGSGKTVWIQKLLKHELFTEKIASVLYCYGVHQKIFDTLTGVELHQGLPSRDKIEQLHDGRFHIVVLDDLMEDIIRSVEAQDLFTKFCHHYNITAIFVTQNIFAQGKYARTINLNAHVLVLFANKRDESQAVFLGRQLFPLHLKYFLEVYEESTSDSYSYLVVDCDPKSPRTLKLRTGIFPGEECVVYLPKN